MIYLENCINKNLVDDYSDPNTLYYISRAVTQTQWFIKSGLPLLYKPLFSIKYSHVGTLVGFRNYSRKIL